MGLPFSKARSAAPLNLKFMPKLKERISQDLKQAMRDKQKSVVSVLRMLISSIKEKEINLRQGEAISLADEQITEVVSREIKKRKDSIESYERGNRGDLADKERGEIKILENYLPRQLPNEEIEEAVRRTIASLAEGEQGNFGRVMGQIMPRLKGRADGSRVSAIVKRVLSEREIK